MCPRPALIALSIVAFAGCTQFPDLDMAMSSDAKNAAFPDLVPVEQIKAGLSESEADTDFTEEMDARVRNLRTRADRLRGTVIDSPTRTRMTAGVTQI